MEGFCSSFLTASTTIVFSASFFSAKSHSGSSWNLGSAVQSFVEILHDFIIAFTAEICSCSFGWLAATSHD